MRGSPRIVPGHDLHEKMIVIAVPVIEGVAVVVGAEVETEVDGEVDPEVDPEVVIVTDVDKFIMLH